MCPNEDATPLARLLAPAPHPAVPSPIATAATITPNHRTVIRTDSSWPF
jgi:hypothetical protein